MGRVGCCPYRHLQPDPACLVFPLQAPAGFLCSPGLFESRQLLLSMLLLGEVRISPGLAPFSLLCSGPGTNVLLIAGDRERGWKGTLGRLGHEELAGRERQTCPVDLWSPLLDSEERQAFVTIRKDMMKIPKTRLNLGLALRSPKDELNRCL